VTASRAVTLVAETMLKTLARTCAESRRGTERLASVGIRVRRTRAAARDAAASAGKMPALHLAPNWVVPERGRPIVHAELTVDRGRKAGARRKTPAWLLSSRVERGIPQ